jgi:hypothetical protein
MLAAILLAQILAEVPAVDPFVFFRPSVSLSLDDRRQLDRGEPIARVLPAKDLEVVVFAAVPVEVDGDRLVAWMRRIEELKKSSYVLAIGRFSNPPRIEDLARLTLDEGELSEVRSCRPAGCSLKLAAVEMQSLRHAAASAGDKWKPALQQAFRSVVLQRVQAYLAGGLAALAPYADKDVELSPAARFTALLGHASFLNENAPAFAEHLSRYPQTPTPDLESFLYWSKERLARRAIISVTHVNILRSPDPGMPDALVAGKEVFSTHYVNASLGLTAILRGGPEGGNYLAYLNRSEVDVLDGAFGGLVRWFLQRRLKSEAADVLRALRGRLERGDPPPLAGEGGSITQKE